MDFEQIPFGSGDQVILPVGIEIEGTRYKEVIIDELCGIDDFNVADKKLGGNTAKGSTVVLARCVQEIVGLLPKKKNSESKFEVETFRKMTLIDRDYLLARIYHLSGREQVGLAGECPRCNRVWEEDVLLNEFPVYSWPEDKQLGVDFELQVGVKDPRTDEFQKKGFMRFPVGRDQELMATIENPAQALDSMLSACIMRLGTLEKVDTEAVKRLKQRDRMALLETFQYDFPGLRQWKEVHCQCGKDFEARLDLTSFFGGQTKRRKRS